LRSPTGSQQATDTLLASDELVRPTEEDLARQIPAQLSTERARDRDRLKGELMPPR
jgi:hypothetical protein